MKTRNFADVIRAGMKADPKLAAAIEQHTFDAKIAVLVYEARTNAGLSQRELADLIGTKQSVIARLEDWDYSGHSLTMLKKIADALGKRLHVEFESNRRSKQPRSKPTAAQKRPRALPASRKLRKPKA